jgi:hypothetical protein
MLACQYRVTKYDPTFRRPNGEFCRDEWTSFSDIGRSFEGRLLKSEEYLSVENAYIDTALEYWKESGSVPLTIIGIESTGDGLPYIANVDRVGNDEISSVVRSLLREDFWCRLQSDVMFIHVGYDYYMYIGVAAPCPNAAKHALSVGLFVEDFPSPHTPNRSDV